MSIGFRIFTQRELPDPQVIEGFRTIPAANIADCMGRLSAMSSNIRLFSLARTDNMVGVALTVKLRAGDNLMIHKALNMLSVGDILVATNSGAQQQALMGEIMITYARSRGIAGIVLDAPIRDLASINQMDLPIYATGSTPAGPFKEGPGEINVPICCGNINVNPGDIIVGDNDGVIVIPKHDAGALLIEAQKYSQFDHAKLIAAQTGKADRSWIDKTLTAMSCEIIDNRYQS